MGKRNSDKIGTDNVPPPIPIIAEKPPTNMPISALIGFLGKDSAMCQSFLPNAICRATKLATTANTPVKAGPRTYPAMDVPRITPTRMNGPHCFSRSTSTAPLRQWLRVELTEVAMMVAKDVPTATCMRTASSRPMVVNRWNSTGTMTMPPPTPSNPAARPPAAPAANKMAASTARLERSSSMIYQPMALGSQVATLG